MTRFFGAFFTILGTFIILFACVAFLNDGKPTLGWKITQWESVVPFLVGTVFLITGVNMMRN
ncbi:hypothetical protein C5O19_05180 [Siphonobacter curvatus]|uniref:Uncharacterized protein n=2 Tax=Cytophagaceae TaxID=89373 RepID=A0A2S7IMV0_9BACT|nr:hypothetical protein C5O19_05180 [Siphonobacter curvatus]